MQIYLIGLIVASLSFLLQIWPRLVKRYFGVDTWKWLELAEYVRTHKRLPKRSSRRYIVNSDFGYPPVIIFFLSIAPKSFLEKYQFIYSPVFDFFHNYFIYFMSVAFTGNVLTGIFAQTVAALVPLLVIEASNLNTRILSILVYTISFASLIMFAIGGSVYWLTTASLFLFILFFTHRFAVQAYAIGVLGLAISEKNLFYPLFFMGVFSLVVLLGGKLYREIFREHLGSIRYWMDKINLRFAHQIRGLSNIGKQDKDFIIRAYNLSVRIPLLYLIASNPWIAVLAILYVSSLLHLLPAPVIYIPLLGKFTVWAMSLVVWAFLVLSVKPLRVVGEGHRYLEYAIFPIALIGGLYAAWLWETYRWSFLFGFIIVAIIVLVGIYELQVKAIIKDRSRTISTSLWRVIAYLNRYGGKDVRLATFPMHLSFAMLYFTKSTVLNSDTYIGQAKMTDVFPVIAKPIGKVLKKYNINHVLFDREYVTQAELGLAKYKIILDIDNYVLLKIQKLTFLHSLG